MSRADVIKGLENERDYLARQPVPNQARLAAVKAELARFSKETAEVLQQEAAVPGPISGARAKSRRSSKTDDTA